MLIAARAEDKTPTARAVVVVVLNGVERNDLPPWRDAETPHLPTLNKLAQSATLFHAHRVPSTLVSATMASLVAGVSPRAHALSDSGARLPAAVHTVASVARESSVRAAMFTGVPTTFEPFGFASGWDKFAAYPPNSGALASAPMLDAGTWLTDAAQPTAEGRPMFAVVHARGGHPPWEVTPDEARKLPPADYTGYFGPRRAAQILAKLQGRHSRLTEQDTERMNALFYAGLSGQDRALGELIAMLEERGLWDSTLFVVTGDVSSSRRELFRDGGALTERALTTPLYVHFPDGKYGGVRVDSPTQIYDITHTALAALGLKKPTDMHGRDLAAIAMGNAPAADRISVAINDDKYSVRWGQFVLHASRDASPKLCALDVDPTCGYDRRHRFPLVAQALFRRFAVFEHSRGKPPLREPLTLDSEAAATLKVWGVY